MDKNEKQGLRGFIERRIRALIEAAFHRPSVEIEVQHDAPKELWDLEMELSNICAYAGIKTRDQLAQRFIEVKTKVRGMIRTYGYTGPF